MHGSNTPGCVDGDKQEMNTMSECQVKAVRGPEKSMMEPLESMKEGGKGEEGAQETVATERRLERGGYREDDGLERVGEKECAKA